MAIHITKTEGTKKPQSNSKPDSKVHSSANKNNRTDLKKDASKSKKQSQKKKGFLITTIEELKKVTWPNFSYVVNWTMVIVVFTLVFSLSLSFFDHVFGRSVTFVNCTSPQGQGQDLGECVQNFGRNLIFLE